MLCVNKSGVEAELKIRNLFERYRKITGLGRKSRKRGSVTASTNAIFKPSDDPNTERSSKLFKTNNNLGDGGVSVVGSRPLTVKSQRDVKDDVSSVVHEAELTHTNYEGLVRQVIGMKKRFNESNLHF